MSIDLGKSGVGNFLISHTRPDGSTSLVDLGVPSPWTLRRAGEAYASGVRSIAPGSQYAFEIPLNDRLDFSAVGRHWVEAEFIGTLRSQATTNVGAQRVAAAEVYILPRDERALRETCERLVREIQSSAPLEAFAAGKKLSLVVDPVAVDYLVRVIEGPQPVPLDLDMVEALERIGGPQARAALLRVASAPRSAARAAREAIDRMDRFPR